ncbi:MAG: hypothetical protein LH629_15090, partial [Ignavibacteria bacterium]|nr:hypothetical protein [Ignavibacteria bacterium]
IELTGESVELPPNTSLELKAQTLNYLQDKLTKIFSEVDSVGQHTSEKDFFRSRDNRELKANKSNELAGEDAPINEVPVNNTNKYLEFLLAVAEKSGEDIYTTLTWRQMGRILTILREQNYTRDLIIRKKFLPYIQEFIEKIRSSDNQLPPNIKLLFAKTCDGFEMATIRLIIFPNDAPWFNDVDGKIQPLYDSFKEFSPIIEVRDISRDPLYLTINSERRLNYEWKGLDDKWHHDLEFIIECLDRYQKIREFFHPNINSQIKYINDNAVAKVSIPRKEEIKDGIMVYPVQTKAQQSIAFRVTESQERNHASKNAVARIRYGNIQLHLTPYRRFEKSNIYREMLKTIPEGENPEIVSLDEISFDENNWSQASTEIQSQFCSIWCKAEGLEEDETIQPIDATDLIKFENMPFYLTYGLSAWITADIATSERTSSSEQTRLPSNLGIKSIPKVRYIDSSTISVNFLLSQFGSHLTPKEADEALLIDFKLGVNEIKDSIPFRELPDLELEYHFFYNVGNEINLKLIPVFSIKFDDKNFEPVLNLFERSLTALDEKPKLSWSVNAVVCQCRFSLNDQDKYTYDQWYLILKRGK